MTAITAEQVKKLRERTGAGMMECKKALINTKGDIDLAVEEMRKSGQAKADKKAGRVAAEGLIVIATNENNTKAAIAEINCETDFVARDDTFKQFASDVTNCTLNARPEDISALLQTPLTDGSEKTVEAARKDIIAKLGENINVRRIYNLESKEGQIGYYVHGGRIGVVVELKGGNDALAKDIAMHIAASNPEVIDKNDYPKDKLDKEREIYVASLQDSGKPADIVEKILQGRLDKFLDQVSLLGQPFVKDPNVTVATLLNNENAKVFRFIRFEVGEGIEKVTSDFAKEVMEQVQGS